MNELALFAGVGGGILGGKLLGWRTVCAVEWDAYARDVLVARQNDGCLDPFPIWDDIQTFDGKPWRGIVDVVSGGFPCQDISAAGKGAGIEGERSGMWKHMARIIGEVLPQFVFVENSPMLVGRGLSTVLSDLAEMGYDAKWGIVGAHHVSAPHRRDRIWVLGRNANSNDVGEVGGIRQGEATATCGIREAMANASGVHDRSGNAGTSQRQESEPRKSRSRKALADTMRERSAAGSSNPPRGEEGNAGKPINGGADMADTASTQDHGIRGDCECGWNSMGRHNQAAQQDLGAPDHVGSCGCCGTLADTNGLRELQPQGSEQEQRGRASYGGATVSDTRRERGQLSTERELSTVEQPRRDSEARSSGGIAGEWWATEPDVGRVANGVAARVDKLRCIGNGQVPGVAALAWGTLSQ